MLSCDDCSPGDSGTGLGSLYGVPYRPIYTVYLGIYTYACTMGLPHHYSVCTQFDRRWSKHCYRAGRKWLISTTSMLWGNGSPCVRLSIVVSCRSTHLMSYLFAVSDDWLVCLSDWLDIRSICRLDSAITNVTERAVWLHNLIAFDAAVVDDYGYCHSSIRWVIKRRVSAKIIRVRDSKRFEITGDTFRGLCIPSICSIDLRSCRNLTDDGVSALAEGCPQLSTIYLSDCVSITYVGLSALANGCPKLSAVILSDGRTLTDEGISALGQGCPLLSSIHLSYCRNITDVGLSALAKGCPFLKYISLYGCRNITDVGVSTLAKSCPRLITMNLRSCGSISNNYFVALRNEYPHIQIRR